PVRVSARREEGGVRIAWIRRTRRDGDAWEPVEVPLGEDAERYAVEILKDGAVRRVFFAGETSLLYPAALEAADFGAPQAMLDLRIAQMSAVAGRGFERIVTVPVL